MKGAEMRPDETQIDCEAPTIQGRIGADRADARAIVERECLRARIRTRIGGMTLPELEAAYERLALQVARMKREYAQPEWWRD